jgi:hypothetical protein
VGEKSSDFPHAHFSRVALVVEVDKAFDPMNMALLSSAAVMPRANGYPDSVKKLQFRWVLGF